MSAVAWIMLALGAHAGSEVASIEGGDAPSADETDAFEATLVTWLTAEPDPMPAAEAAEQARWMVEFERAIPWQTGRVEIDGIAALDLRPGDRFVGTAGAAQVLEIWGNPPGQEHSGMILPPDTHLFGPGSWAVIVNYEDIGWVDDSDAGTIDYDELLATMKEVQPSWQRGA